MRMTKSLFSIIMASLFVNKKTNGGKKTSLILLRKKGRINMSLSNNLSKNLNTIRENRNLSITDFADELCIARSSLQNILKGDCNLRMDTVNQISSQLNVDPLTLLQDPHTADQQDIAVLLLNCIEVFHRLPYQDRVKATELFVSLITLLDTP